MTIPPSWEMYPIKNNDIIQKKIGVSIQFLISLGQLLEFIVGATKWIISVKSIQIVILIWSQFITRIYLVEIKK